MWCELLGVTVDINSRMCTFQECATIAWTHFDRCTIRHRLIYKTMLLESSSTVHNDMHIHSRIRYKLNPTSPLTALLPGPRRASFNPGIPGSRQGKRESRDNEQFWITNDGGNQGKEKEMIRVVGEERSTREQRVGARAATKADKEPKLINAFSDTRLFSPGEPHRPSIAD